MGEILHVEGDISSTMYDNGSYSIRRFVSKSPVDFPDGTSGRRFTIKGFYIPDTTARIKLDGKWESSKPYIGKNKRKIFTFIANNCEVVRQEGKENIIATLKELKGVGPVTAKAIYRKFGDDTFIILDRNIERLKEIPGISKKKFKVISESYLSIDKNFSEVRNFFSKYQVRNHAVVRMYQRFGQTTLAVAQTNPYSLFMEGYFSFNIAEKIAKDNKLSGSSEARIQACILQVLKSNELYGNTCIDWNSLRNECFKLLGVANASKEIRMKAFQYIQKEVKAMKKFVSISKTSPAEIDFYRKYTAYCENTASQRIAELLSATPVSHKSYHSDILIAEKNVGLTLSEEQKNAVNLVMNSPLTIVTGGPGTGKTAFQKVLMEVFKKNNPHKDILLSAPTGRAARRMTESSGIEASTIHRILEMRPMEEQDTASLFNPPDVEIRSGLFIIDEMSMVDVFLASNLFQAIKTGTKVVCIGDVFQLPSVGPGSVLKDLIDCGRIPIVRFTKVFRQDGKSSIALNAAKINAGEKNLDEDDSFVFVQKNKSEGIVESVQEEYKKALREYGEDEVCVLTPYRRSTITGVNKLNPVLRDIANPKPEVESKTNKIVGRDLYLGDKIMFTKNDPDLELTNGDIGYIREITYADKVQTICADFGDGRIVDLSEDDLDHVVPAFSMTIHKSQGSEYKCCIIVIDNAHSSMLTRNLVYTAITRARTKCVLIGDKAAFYGAIDKEDTIARKSGLKRKLEGNIHIVASA